jgi:hypothetical protein
MIRRDGYEEFNSAELEKWDTRRLMAHFDMIRSYRTNASRRLEMAEETMKEMEWDLKLYDSYLAQLKDVLSTREHIPNKQEAKVLRQEKAKAKRNR